MKLLASLLALCLVAAGCSSQPGPSHTTADQPQAAQSATSFYDFSMTTLDGKEQPLSAYKGKVVIVVNVASKCGYTPQYADLERFYTQNKDKGVVVLGFPANNFMGQEPGTDEEIASFCQKNYGVTFPMFSKISVKGKDIHPLYAYLTEAVGASISWNFNKILIDKNGKPVAHFKSGVKPGDPEFDEAVAKLL